MKRLATYKGSDRVYGTSLYVDSRHGHTRQTHRTSFALAERLCRRADRIDPARMPRPLRHLGRGPLRRVLQSYAEYYNKIRTHRSLDKDAPVSRPVQRPETSSQILFLAAFITIMYGFRFSVHTALLSGRDRMRPTEIFRHLALQNGSHRQIARAQYAINMLK